MTSQGNSPDEASDQAEYAGGDGSSPEEAVCIKGAPSHAAGVRAESAYISRKFGERGEDWELKEQSLTEREDGQRIDKMTIETAAGEVRTIYFDVSDFFGMDLPDDFV
jgi:hypothetical protein